MIQKIAGSWPSLRQVIYTVLAMLLGAAFIFGWVTADQQTAILEQATKLLAAAGFILAAFYTPGGPKVEASPTSDVVAPGLNQTIGGAIKDFSAAVVKAGPTVAELRSKLEQSLRRSDG